MLARLLESTTMILGRLSFLGLILLFALSLVFFYNFILIVRWWVGWIGNRSTGRSRFLTMVDRRMIQLLLPSLLVVVFLTGRYLGGPLDQFLPKVFVLLFLVFLLYNLYAMAMWLWGDPR